MIAVDCEIMVARWGMSENFLCGDRACTMEKRYELV